MNLPEPSSIQRVGVIGTGTIGASWAAYFLARGMEVQAWDPASDAEAALRAFVDGAWPTLEGLDTVTDGASPDRLTFHVGPGEAVDGVGFVQESAPENLDVKRVLYGEVDAALPDGVVMSSSTSGLIMSELQAGFSNAARFVVGHPFNPPHLIPLVEVVGGADTDAGVVDWTIDFYNTHGKKAIRLNHEAPRSSREPPAGRAVARSDGCGAHRARERGGCRRRHQVRPGAAPERHGDRSSCVTSPADREDSRTSSTTSATPSSTG